MSNESDTRAGRSTTVQPLNARSLALSALLGTHPPALPARGLVALADVFGINAGTMRTALSRLVAAGDVTADDGIYTLAPRLIARQVAQDAGRRRLERPWNGEWHTAVATVDHRNLTDRRHVRAAMANARFGELRPAIWLRPANLASPDLGIDWLVTTGPTRGTSAGDLVDRLWDLAELRRTANDLLGRIERLGVAEPSVERFAERSVERSRADEATIPVRFSLSAEVVRFLRSDPLLPEALLPEGWPIDELRTRYRLLERDLQHRLRPILAG